MKKIINNKYFLSSIMIIVGLFLGWLLFHQHENEQHEHSQEEKKKELWTCSMHPQIRIDHFGKCPLCAMDLIPVQSDSKLTTDTNAVHFSEEAAQLANVNTSIVSKQKPIKEVRLYGKVQVDERQVQNQVSHISGRIEKLFVNFTGEKIQKGQLLALIYSPELLTAQQELIEASKNKAQDTEIYEASRHKLAQWMLTENQINQIEASGKVKTNFEVYSNTTGIVSAKRVAIGDHISEGTTLFEIANLSEVWVLFDAYESDLAFLKIASPINFSIQALPGMKFSSKIQFIDPVIDPVNRVAKVRVEVNNRNGLLKPEMFANGIVSANLSAYKDQYVIPRSAVLWTGKRSIVYVKIASEEGLSFKMREIELGPLLGNSYVVESGLEEGEEIVTDGTFSVDAAAQLSGKPSMMNQE